MSFFSRVLHNYSSGSKLLVLCSISSGGLIACAEAHSDAAVEHNQVEPQKKRVVVLGTGWAATSFLKDLDAKSYDVKVVSPRNYFAFTPLLPSVTCGTVEARSIVEPIRNITKKRSGQIQFWEADCLKIDPANKKVFCRSSVDENLVGNDEFSLEYDYLVIAVGAEVNTFNTPGVLEHCHFLKEVEDAQRIRRAVIDCFEKAVLPELTEEERKTNLHFVIVGGGPTGIEFAAELHDFLHEDLLKIYPLVTDLVKITVIQSGDHILNMFDERISSFAEQKFQRDGIDVLTGCRVVNVSDKLINMKIKSTGEDISMPHGMVLWSTGVGTRPVVKDFMEQIGQGNRRILATDEWLRVKGCEDVYALGDCATVDQRKIREDISTIFKAADKDDSGILTIEEFQDVVEDIIIRYPQVELYLKSKHFSTLADLLKDSEGNERDAINIEVFKLALSHVDLQMKSLPATAQVAAQQGSYLSRCFNLKSKGKHDPEGPRRFSGSGRHEFRPFRFGGLGIRSLVLFNKALLGKWLWRFGVERESFWREIIGAKYGVMEGGWCSGERRGPYGVSLWRHIRRGWSDFRERLTFVVGNGNTISFWDDCWCGDQPLKLRFPTLYRIALEPSAKVNDVLDIHNGNPSWNIVFSRGLQDWELNDHALFLTSFYEVHIRAGEGDCSRWRLTRDGTFSVRTYFRCLLGPFESSFPWKMVWNSKLPPRVAFLL